MAKVKMMASFNFQDIYRPYRMLIMSGAIAGVIGILTTSAGNVVIHHLQKIDSVVLPLKSFNAGVVQTDTAILSDTNLYSGSALLQTLTPSLMELENGPAWGEHEVFRSKLIPALQQLRQALRPIIQSQSQHAVIVNGVRQLSPLLAQAVKRNESARGNAALQAAAGRLINLGSFQYGFNMYPQIDYDLRTVAPIGNDTAELRQVIDQLQSALNAVRSTVPSYEQTESASQAMKYASNEIAAYERVSGGLNSGTVFVLAGLLLTAGGLATLIAGLLLSIRDLGKRFHDKSIHFRAQESHLKELSNSLRQLLNGDLSTVCKEEGQGQVNEAAVLLNDVGAVLSKAFANISQKLNEISASANDGLNSSGATLELVNDVQRILKSNDDLMLALFDSLNSANYDQEAVKFAIRNTLQCVQKTGLAVSFTADNLSELRGVVQETSKRVKRLSERSQEIGVVTEILERLSEQVSALHLNASLEAERAGESGRGFIIIASEIKKMSIKMNESLKRISPLVAGIQGDTREAIDSMERVSQKIVQGAHMSSMAGAAIDTVRILVEQNLHEAQGMETKIGECTGQSHTAINSLTSVYQNMEKQVKPNEQSADLLGKIKTQSSLLANQSVKTYFDMD